MKNNNDQDLQAWDSGNFFEEIYASAEGDSKNISWADMRVNPSFESWLKAHPLQGFGKKALVIGSGLGDDAERLSELGFAVTAFDISPTAIAWTKKRFPDSKVHYKTADLFNPPKMWVQAFDFVLEIYTIQSLPVEMRREIMACIAIFVRPEGKLLVLCRGRDEEDVSIGPPWPLSKKEADFFKEYDLKELSCEDYFDNENPPVRRFRIFYHQQ